MDFEVNKKFHEISMKSILSNEWIFTKFRLKKTRQLF